MIPFEFEYHAPENLDEALELYLLLDADNKKPVYYSGGTEIISLYRHRKITTGAVIDLKSIPETKLFEIRKEKLVIGAAVTLSRLTDDEKYPLLAGITRHIADRTVRNRLTVGGNICGKLPYREAVLPFLLSDSEVVLAGPNGRRTEKIGDIFNKRLRLETGELLVQFLTPVSTLKYKSWSKRREKHGPVDYPLLHLAAVDDGSWLSLAVSGLCAFPFRHATLEELLNDRNLPIIERVEKSLSLLPGDIRSDELGSADYRESLWQHDLTEMLNEMEGAR
ncbi:MAG: FAD binding domain-containing protein [Dethiobacteria bacterium]|nr:FAD binding domain-containing protein [Bacillota bacterium]MDW7730189.1 FAD binding domain-containing protein [Bacillota bacterium]